MLNQVKSQNKSIQNQLDAALTQVEVHKNIAKRFESENTQIKAAVNAAYQKAYEFQQEYTMKFSSE